MTKGNEKTAPYLPSQEDLDSIDLPIQEFPAGSIFYRIHHTQYSPFYFPNRHNNPDHKPGYRFDDPQADFGVMYMSCHKVGAFAETISRQFFGEFTTNRVLFWQDYNDRRLTKIRTKQPISLVDLTSGPNLLRLGVDAQLSSSDDYSWTQRWARQLYDHRDEIDGIYFPARHAPETRSLALFERFSPQNLEIVASLGLTPDDIPFEILEYLDKAGFGFV